MEIAPETKARDFHIPTATGPSLSLQVRLRAALATDPRGCVAKRHHRTQKKGGPAKKYLTGIAVFRDALPLKSFGIVPCLSPRRGDIK